MHNNSLLNNQLNSYYFELQYAINHTKAVTDGKSRLRNAIWSKIFSRWCLTKASKSEIKNVTRKAKKTWYNENN